MWLPGIRRLHEGLRDCLDEAGLLDDLIEMLNHTNGMLIIAESWRGGLHPVLARTFVLENLKRIDDFARALPSMSENQQ